LTNEEKANIQQRTAKDIFKYLPQLQDDVTKVMQYKELELNRTFDQDYKNRQLDQQAELLREQIAARKELAKTTADAKIEAAKEKRTEAGTEGQKAVDKKYATDYNEFTAKGQVNVKNSIEKLEALASEMEKDQGIGESGGGRIGSILPDVMRSRDAVRRRDAARNEANRTLKALFPGALSDAEREAAAKEFYNDALDNKENAKILRTKVEDLKSGLTQELAKAKYYEKNGTLKGFAGSDLSGERKTQSVSGPYGDTTERNGKKYKWNPTAGKYQLIGQ
jgi:hypothetical protein